MTKEADMGRTTTLLLVYIVRGSLDNYDAQNACDLIDIISGRSRMVGPVAVSSTCQ